MSLTITAPRHPFYLIYCTLTSLLLLLRLSVTPSHLSGYQIGLSAGATESAMGVGKKRAYVKESLYRKLTLPFYFVSVYFYIYSSGSNPVDRLSYSRQTVAFTTSR
jgi:hypothetical protein